MMILFWFGLHDILFINQYIKITTLHGVINFQLF